LTGPQSPALILATEPWRRREQWAVFCPADSILFQSSQLERHTAHLLPKSDLGMQKKKGRKTINNVPSIVLQLYAGVPVAAAETGDSIDELRTGRDDAGGY